jgi:DNA-binding transcriptional ArsR family regulator
MVKDMFERKAELLTALANAQRLRMLTELSNDEISVGPLAQRLGLSQSALSQHLAKLRSLDLVSTRRDAQTVYYSVKSPHVQAVLQTLVELFDQQEKTAQQLAS